MISTYLLFLLLHIVSKPQKGIHGDTKCNYETIIPFEYKYVYTVVVMVFYIFFSFLFFFI